MSKKFVKFGTSWFDLNEIVSIYPDDRDSLVTHFVIKGNLDFKVQIKMEEAEKILKLVIIDPAPPPDPTGKDRIKYAAHL